MSTFARIDGSIVVGVIIADQQFIDQLNDGFLYVECFSDANGEPDKRYNMARFGGTYDANAGAFYDERPFVGWQLDASYKWKPPTPEPDDGQAYDWDNETQSWVLYEGE